MTNEIQKNTEKPLATLSPDQMPELQPPDDGDTIKIPRLKLIQDLSPERKEGIAKAGSFINSLTKEEYGGQIKIVPLVQRPMTRIRWAARDQGGRLLCISRNKTKPSGDPGDVLQDCQACEFYKNFDPKLGCTTNYEMIALIINGEDPKFWEPILIVAESTRPSDSGFRDIVANIRFNAGRGIRMFHKAYELKSLITKNNKGEFYKVSCIPADKNGLLPLDTIDFLEAQVRFFLGAKIDTEGAHEEKATAPAETADTW